MTRDPLLRDEGFTLVEMLIAMAMMLLLMGAFFLMFFAFSHSEQGTQALSNSQSQSRLTLQLLEADLRSADPLMDVPMSLLDTYPQYDGLPTSDAVAMFETVDLDEPCVPASSTSTTTTLPSIYQDSSAVANVVWAYEPPTAGQSGVLTRYSYLNCGSGSAWVVDTSLANVANGSLVPPKSVFTVIPPAGQIPNSGTLTGSLSPACAVGIEVRLDIEAPHQSQPGPFDDSVEIPLPNQPAVEAQACG